MSTDYYLLCPKCNKGLHVAQNGPSGFSFYSGEPDCMKAIKPFLAEHVLCGDYVRLVPEYYNYEFEDVEWSESQPLTQNGGGDE